MHLVYSMYFLLDIRFKFIGHRFYVIRSPQRVGRLCYICFIGPAWMAMIVAQR